MYHVGVECLKQLKDKERMRGYINLIPVNKQWEYREKIESLLSNSVGVLVYLNHLAHAVIAGNVYTCLF